MSNNDDVKVCDLLNPNQPRSDEEIREYRLGICRGCEFFKPRFEKCGKCGCFMRAKAMLDNAKCPIGKW